MKDHLRTRSKIVCVVLAACAVNLSWTTGPRAQETVERDALQRKARAQLRSFTDWLEDNGSQGYVGEIGWPDDFRGDASEWNGVARGWFDLALEEDLWVSGWATGEWWDDYRLSMYDDWTSGDGVDSVNTQAGPIEAAARAAGVQVGITVNGGEFGSPITAKDSSFSNRSPGAYNTRYHYDRQGTFDFLAGRDMGHVRIPFRWERIQPRLGGPLDPDELARIRGAVARAADAGLRSILDVHNYGAYYLDRDGRGVRTPIGSARCTVANFVDLWRRMSLAFKGDERVLMYALMAEPFGLPRVNDVRPAKLWEKASQRALSAIRATGDNTMVAVPGYGWDALQVFMRNHEDGWIEDPADNFVYEVHHYWDSNYSGDYTRSYEDEVARADKAGW